LERFYDPVEGGVFLDGVDLRTLDVSWLRKCIGLIAQEPVLFGGTIGDNIAYGKPEATRSEIIAAAQDANAHRFIDQLPAGYDTDLGSDVTQLSGGQKQRVAIARAVISDPAILLMDDATSALDSESEQIVQAALDRLIHARARTTIVISHRLSTIQNSDRIAVLYEGAIVETGCHSDLLRMNGHYAKLASTA
jgi:ATP-binding cassette subfamily B (MDR/TAP) protein 1